MNPDLKYEIKGDAVTITSCEEGASGKLVIPATIEGKTVTSIGEDAFWGCASLTSIKSPVFWENTAITLFTQKTLRDPILPMFSLCLSEVWV